jgi:hypothetical protein
VIGSFFGSMENFPFSKRSLKSLCVGISMDHRNDDIQKTYEIFSELKRIDPNFVDSCLVDKDDKIRAVMWTSGKSRMQYKHFGSTAPFELKRTDRNFVDSCLVDKNNFHYEKNQQACAFES